MSASPDSQLPAPIARTIAVRLAAPQGGLLSPAAIPEERVDATRFLGQAFPGHRIAHQASPALFALPEHEGGMAPHSLFFRALALCFSQHYPLALRPEVLAYLISHEVAETVKRHPATYRALYTAKDRGKTEIAVRDDSLDPARPSDWGRALAQFEAELRPVVPSGILDATLPELSTHTPASRVAALCAFMDAASPYYQYSVLTLCGIPSLRLLGTLADWQRLHDSTTRLAALFPQHLGSYFQHLLPVLAKLAAQADPSVPIDHDFWASIYKLHSASGGDTVTGWATAFVRYLKQPSGELVPKPERLADWSQHLDDDGLGAGIGHDHFALHVSSVPFRWNYLGQILPMKLVGGILALTDEDGFVTPALSYAVLHAPNS